MSKILRIDLPDDLAEELEALIENGWFTDEQEIGRLALAGFLRRHRFEIEEAGQREDIRWSLHLRSVSS